MEVAEKETKLSESEAIQLLIKDLALLAHKCKIVMENAQHEGTMVQQAAEALILCKHVEDRWIKKD